MMNPRANADGKPSEKVEAEDSLRTVECLRGRLLAERVASRNAKQEVELMENKLIELEKKLVEEYKSKKRAEKKLKFLMKKLHSINIPYIPFESEQSGSGLGSDSVERSEISSSIESSATSSSTKEVADDKENSANFPNSDSLSVPDAGNTNSSSDGINSSPQLTIQDEEIEEFKEKKFESPNASNNFEQNACSYDRNQDKLPSQEVMEKSESSSDSNNCEQNGSSFSRNQYTPASQKLVENSKSSSVSSNCEQNACSFARNHYNPVSQKVEENSESSSVLGNCEQNTSSFTGNHDNPESQKVEENSESSSVSINLLEQNTSSFARNHNHPERQKVVKMSESSSVSNNSEQNSFSSPEYHDTSAAGEGTGVNPLELTMKIQTESPIESIQIEQDACGSYKEDHEIASATATATETISSINRIDFHELTLKNESKAKNEFPANVSIKSDQNACTNNQRHVSSGTQQEIYSDNNEPKSTKQKKHDRSLRTLLRKEKMGEENEGGEQDDQVDNSLAMVPVDLPIPKPKEKRMSVDPVIIDATVKDVLGVGSLRNEKLQASMERRRSNMIKVG